VRDANNAAASRERGIQGTACFQEGGYCIFCCRYTDSKGD